LIPAPDPDEDIVRAAADGIVSRNASDPWSGLTGFRANGPAYTKIDVAVADRNYSVAVDPMQLHASIATIDGQQVLFRRGEAWGFGPPDITRSAGAATASDGSLRSPMPGRIVSVSVQLGQAVAKGEPLIALEAMKMEHALLAPFDGTVVELAVSVGDQVAENVTLVRVAGADDAAAAAPAQEPV